MKPATLSEIIELHAPTRTADGRGGFTVGHVFEREIFAQFRPYGGGLSIESEQPSNAYPSAFVCNYESLYGVTERYKVKYRGKMYTIKSIEAKNRYIGMINVAEQGANITEIYEHL